MLLRSAPLAIVSIVVLLTACSGQESGSPSAVPARTTLTVAQSASPQTFAPTFTDGSQPYLLSVYDTLTGVDSEGNPTPVLAESWEQSEDGLTITFDLSDDATFHDGSPVTADSVVYSMNWLLDPENAQNLAPRFEAVLDSVSAPDDDTFVIELNVPAPGLFYLLSEFLIINEAAMDSTATTDAGSGPYVITAVSPGSSFTMSKYEDYFRDGIPTLDEITVRTIADPEAQYAALQNGEVDMIFAAADQTALQVVSNPAFSVQNAAMGALNPYLMLNTSRPPLDNKLVRQAIAHAVNRDAMVQVAFPGGSAEPNCQPFAPESPFFVSDFDGAACDYDLDRAKELLDEAGYPDGFSITVNVSSNYGPPGTPDMAQILQADLAEIGVTLSVNTLDGAVARDDLLNSNFDMVIHSYSASNADPTFFVPSRTFGPERGFSTFSTPELTSIIGAASVDLEPESRKAEYEKFADLVSDEAYIVHIGSASVLYVMDSAVQNVGADISGWPIFGQTTIGG